MRSDGFHDFIGFVDIVPRERIDEHGPGVAAVIFDLFQQQIFCPSDTQARFIISPDGDMNLVTDRFGNALKTIRGNTPQRHFPVADLQELREPGTVRRRPERHR